MDTTFFLPSKIMINNAFFIYNKKKHREVFANFLCFFDESNIPFQWFPKCLFLKFHSLLSLPNHYSLNKRIFWINIFPLNITIFPPLLKL